MGVFRYLGDCLRDSRGASLLELAIVAPLLAMLVAGVVDLGRGLSAKFALNQAVHRSLEKAAVSNRRTDYGYLKAETANAAAIAPANVTIDAWLECDGQRKASFADSCAPEQQISRYVKVTAITHFRPMFDYGFAQASNAAGIELKADASMRVQ